MGQHWLDDLIDEEPYYRAYKQTEAVANALYAVYHDLWRLNLKRRASKVAVATAEQHWRDAKAQADAAFQAYLGVTAKNREITRKGIEQERKKP